MSFVLLALIACHHSSDGGPDGNGTPTDTTPTPADECADSPGASLCVGGDAVTCDADGHVATDQPCAETDVCLDGVCASCALGVISVPYADPDLALAKGIHLQVDPGVLAGTATAARTPYQRPVDLVGDATLSFSGPVDVLDPDGHALATGDPVHGGDRLLLVATGVGDGTLTFAGDGCSAELAFDAAPAEDLAGRPMDRFPWFETPNLFSYEDDHVSVLLDPGIWHDRVGVPFDVYVVPYRDASEWASDPDLAHAHPVAGPVAGKVGAKVEGGNVNVWTPDAPTDVTTPYSVVVDFGQDGKLDPGDLVDGYDTPGLYVSSDLSAAGPYTPTSLDVTELTYWHNFMLYWPQEVDSLNPLPLVVISHGNGHDYHWYDYLGNHFASYGYVVVVHRNDTADSSIVPAATTTWENTEAFLTNLDSIAGGALAGHVDSHHIAWIGHSRGGEGVVMAYKWLETGQIHPSSFEAGDLQLVASIAPTTFNPTTVVDPAHVPVYSLIAGSADGDVTGGVDSYVVEYWRIFQNHLGLQTAAYVHGATHNDFNCCGFNDGAGVGPGPKIGRPTAQQIAKSYFLAELEAVFHGHDELWEYFSRAPEKFAPPGVHTPVVTQLKRAPGDRQIVIDDFQGQADAHVSSSGGAVAMTVTNYAEGAMNDANSSLSATKSEAFNGMTWSENGDDSPAGGAVFDWESGADESIEWAMVDDQTDWRDDSFVSFRVCEATRHPYVVDLDGVLSFTVEAEDADGNRSDVDFEAHGGVPPPFKRSGLGQGVGWTNEFQTIRVPIRDFVADGTKLDLGHMAKLRFRFGSSWGSDEGRIGLDDLMLLQEVLP